MGIRQIAENKKDYLELLLLGDEQEDMIDRYLERGDLFVLEEEGAVLGVCVVTEEGPGVYELKNIAVEPVHQRKGHGRALIEHLFFRYAGYLEFWVGTGDVPSVLNFYHALGFREFRREKDFFTKNYDHPIYEEGILLTDMVYLRWQAGK